MKKFLILGLFLPISLMCLESGNTDIPKGKEIKTLMREAVSKIKNN